MFCVSCFWLCYHNCPYIHLLAVSFPKRHLPEKTGSKQKLIDTTLAVLHTSRRIPRNINLPSNCGASYHYLSLPSIMESCQVCKECLDTERVVSCSGSCGMAFHSTCVGLTNAQYATWTSKVGMFWFCKSCRLNFEPAVYERDKIILKALRKLLIRTDAMDTRLGNYGENLKKINKTLYDNHRLNQSKPLDSSLHQTFLQTIDEMTFDDVDTDPINRSRSCEETSFFEVLDEVNSSIAMAPNRFVVGQNKRVQIVENQSTSTNHSANAPRINNSTPAATSHNPRRITTHRDTEGTPPQALPGGSTSRPNNHVLRVANSARYANNDDTFYVTPFAPDQTEEDVKQYVCDISNADLSQVQVTKLVPRGKRLEELSFVSFKVSVDKTYSNVVSDAFYWPEGITVRAFDPIQKTKWLHSFRNPRISTTKHISTPGTHKI